MASLLSGWLLGYRVHAAVQRAIAADNRPTETTVTARSCARYTPVLGSYDLSDAAGFFGIKKMIPEVEKQFTYHAPKPGQPEQYQRLREKAKELAYLIHQECPPSRERSVALTELETSVFWANAAIARNE